MAAGLYLGLDAAVGVDRIGSLLSRPFELCFERAQALHRLERVTKKVASNLLAFLTSNHFCVSLGQRISAVVGEGDAGFLPSGFRGTKELLIS
jgi:hypothetical protein